MKPNLLYFYPKRATFIEKDITILKDNYTVISQNLEWPNKNLLALNFIKQLFFILKNLKNTSVFIVMFGGYWSFLPTLMGRIFNKKVFVILGGTDCVSFPEFNYGSLRKQPLKWFIKKSCQWAYKLLPVDESLILSDYHYLPKATYKKQGVKAFFKNLKTPFTVIPNGFDTSFWKVNKDKITANSFISVAYVSDDTRLTLKGFDTLVKLAEQFKEASFTMVGLSIKMTQKLNLPPNIKVYNHLSREKIRDEFASHSYYLQLSLSEGFPNALAEAMLCQCIPIGTAVGGIPKIIVNYGYVAPQQDLETLIAETKKLLTLPQSELKKKGKAAREHIVTHYSLENRAKLLNSVLTQ